MWRAFICMVFRPFRNFLRCISVRTCPHSRYTETKCQRYGQIVRACPDNQRLTALSKKIWSVSKPVLAILCLMSIAFASALLKHSHGNSVIRCPSAGKNVPKVGRSALRKKDMCLGVGLTHSIGDSLFRYAAAVNFATKHGRELTLDTGAPNPLQEIFDVRYSRRVDLRCWQKVEESSTELMEEVFGNFSNVNLKLEGIFQSWKYWKDFDPVSTVRRELRFRRSVVEHAKEVIRERVGVLYNSSKTFIGIHIVTKKLINQSSAGKTSANQARWKLASSGFGSTRISVRNGDVFNAVGSPKQSIDSYDLKHGGVHSRIKPLETSTFPTLYYITRAMDHMRLTFGQVVFLVFCEDPGWCGRKMKFSDAVILRNLPQSLQLVTLALTRASILTTGSLGWWGAWLSQGYTVYPKDYPWDFLHSNQTNITAADYFLPSWVPL